MARPFISPDGAWVAFFREGKISKVSSNGSNALPICDACGDPRATWDGAGRLVFFADVAFVAVNSAGEWRGAGGA